MAQKKKKTDKQENKQAHGDANPDPITGAKGSHPVGTGLGAAAGGVTGAAAGAAAGAAIGASTTGPAAPAGAIVGAVAGAIAGGYAGKGVAEQINPTVEEQYWREHFRDRPYVQAEGTYDDYGPAYRFGWESRARYPDRDFAELEPELQREWEQRRGSSKLNWSEAREACRDGWAHCLRQQQQDDDQLRPSEGI